MIIAYSHYDHLLQQNTITAENQAMLKNAMWIDLISPSTAEKEMVEHQLNLSIPTRNEMRDIELSSRLYTEKKTLFMTASMLAHADSSEPQYDAVTFILNQKQLITLRYIEPHVFRVFTSKLAHSENPDALMILLGLLDASTERLAHILETISHHLEKYSKMIFRPEKLAPESPKIDYQQLLQHIGISADINSKAHESLVAFNRLIIFLTHSPYVTINKHRQLHLDTLQEDINALSEYTNFIFNKVNFLLDASLGLLSTEQDRAIKTLSAAALIFLPPTLIASIYGMNFHFMPELSWHFGYPMALVLMALSGWLPYRYFKNHTWR